MFLAPNGITIPNPNSTALKVAKIKVCFFALFIEIACYLHSVANLGWYDDLQSLMNRSDRERGFPAHLAIDPDILL